MVSAQKTLCTVLCYSYFVSTGTVIISTPQDVALDDVRKGIAMFRTVGIPVRGSHKLFGYLLTSVFVFGFGTCEMSLTNLCGNTDFSYWQISCSRCTFFLGVAFGPLFVGALSEIFGRSRIVQLANLFYLGKSSRSYTVLVFCI